MERSPTYERLRRHNQKLDRLCRLTADVAKLGDERATLQKIVDTAASLIGVQAAHLALVDRDDETLYGVVSSGRHPAGTPHLRFELAQSSAAQEALRGRKPVLIGQADGDARVNALARRTLGIRGVAYLPLLGGRQSFGLLILVTGSPRRWSLDEVALARHFASVASVALENSRLMSHLAETELRFRSLVEHIPAIVYLCDVEPPYRTRYISPQARAMLGYTQEEWIEDTDLFMKLIHPEDIGELIDLTEQAVRAKGFATTEYRLLDRRGETRWFRDEAVLVRDPSGNPVAWHGVIVEISGLKKLES